MIFEDCRGFQSRTRCTQYAYAELSDLKWRQENSLPVLGSCSHLKHSIGRAICTASGHHMSVRLYLYQRQEPSSMGRGTLVGRLKVPKWLLSLFRTSSCHLTRRPVGRLHDLLQLCLSDKNHVYHQ